MAKFNLDDIYDKKIINKPLPEPKIGVDTKDGVINDVVDNHKSPDGLNLLPTISMERDQQYQCCDDMLADSRIASIVETYTEDVCNIGDDGRVVYCDSEDSNISKMVTFILDSINVDKYIYSWASSLIKYGDVYVRLFRESDTQVDDMFDNKNSNTKSNSRLHEDVELNYYNKNIDHYDTYVKQIANPAEMFELKKNGKTKAFVQCPINSLSTNKITSTQMSYFVRLRDTNVKLFQPTEFVHAALNQGIGRTEETLDVFGEGDSVNSFDVNRGQSLLYNTYQAWKMLQILENSLMLSRINQSAMLRIMQVEVGNIPDKDEVDNIVMSVSNMLQTKLSLSTDTMSQLYLSEQPTINYAVMPIKNGAGTLSSQEIGGKVENGDLDDIEYFRNKLYGSLRVPKDYFGETSGDSAGFDAGESLAQKSLRYGKGVRRIQNALIQMITDLVNLFLLDRGLVGYINKFSIKMHFPITQEDNQIQQHKADQVDLVGRIMDSVGDVVNDTAKATILKYLITTVIDDADVLMAIQSELEDKENMKNEDSNEDEESSNYEDEDNYSPSNRPSGMSSMSDEDDVEAEPEDAEESEEFEEPELGPNEIESESEPSGMDNAAEDAAV